MTAPVKVRVSEQEYLATMTDEKPSLEFVNGEVFQKPMTKKDHNEVAMALYDALRDYKKRRGGYATWEATTNLSRLADKRYRVPDLAFWETDRVVAQPDNVYLPPTLAVEIRSEGQSMRSLREKCTEYRSRGIDVCWLIDLLAGRWKSSKKAVKAFNSTSMLHSRPESYPGSASRSQSFGPNSSRLTGSVPASPIYRKLLWSGRRESNPRLNLGKVAFCH